MAWNVETFVPRYKSRRRSQSRTEPCYSFKPLFPGYIFARFNSEDMFHKIRYTRGVHSVVSLGNVPAPLDDAIIEMMMSRRDGDGFINLEDDIRSGDPVVVNGGVLGGFIEVFDRRMKDSDRVVILLKSVNQLRVIVAEKSVAKHAV